MFKTRLAFIGLVASIVALVGALVGVAPAAFACTGGLTGCTEGSPSNVSLTALSGGLNLPSVSQDLSVGATNAPTIGGPANGYYTMLLSVQDYRGDAAKGWTLSLNPGWWTGPGAAMPTYGSIVAAGVAVNPVGPNTTWNVIAPVATGPLSAGTPAQFATAPLGSLGDFGGSVRVSGIGVPGNATTGPYAATVTITVASSP